uniref:Uncharacterized protein n=1 Tax=Anguilla anguilla TaxID=7936 RepID=A0A0E9QE33_ANGAN
MWLWAARMWSVCW